MRLEDKRDPAYWRAIKPDSTLTLTDEQALRADVCGQSYLVKQVIKIREKSGICEWLLFEIEGQGDAFDSWLMAKLVDQEVDIRVYFEPDPGDFESGNRNDMVEQDNLFLFQPPEDPDDFTCEELEYAKHIGWDFPGDEEGDDDIHVDYNVKVGELQGNVSYDPDNFRTATATVGGTYPSGQDELLATIVEFDTSDETTCPEMFVLEIGHPDNDEGGLIRLFFGNSINPTEVDVLAVTSA